MLDTFDGNKAFTSEDPITNTLICKSLNINPNAFAATPDARSASASPVQVLGEVPSDPNAGADAVERDGSNPSEDHAMEIAPALRRSARLASRRRDEAVT